jgi:hypothetical protein
MLRGFGLECPDRGRKPVALGSAACRANPTAQDEPDGFSSNGARNACGRNWRPELEARPQRDDSDRPEQEQDRDNVGEERRAWHGRMVCPSLRWNPDKVATVTEVSRTRQAALRTAGAEYRTHAWKSKAPSNPDQPPASDHHPSGRSAQPIPGPYSGAMRAEPALPATGPR